MTAHWDCGVSRGVVDPDVVLEIGIPTQNDDRRTERTLDLVHAVEHRVVAVTVEDVIEASECGLRGFLFAFRGYDCGRVGVRQIRREGCEVGRGRQVQADALFIRREWSTRHEP